MIMPPPSKLFFFHNPKAAGTSLIEAIQTLGAGLRPSPHIAHTIREHARLAGRYRDFRGYDFYIGHYSRDVFEAVRDGHAFITNFRHPVSRIVSLYNYFRFVVPQSPRMTDDARIDFHCVDAAKTLSFDDFVRCDHPDVRVYTSDHHFRQLTGSQWVYETPATRIEDACAFIDQALCYYVCEYPEASLRQFSLRLGISSLPTLNITRERPDSVVEAEIGAETRRAILDINTRDMAIYRHAVARLLEREQAGEGGRESVMGAMPRPPAQANVTGAGSDDSPAHRRVGLRRLAARVGVVLERGLVRRARVRLRGPAHPRPTGPRQLLIDVSRIHQHDAGTGIQRVVRALLGHLHAAPPSGCVIRTVAGTRRRPYRYVDGPPGADDRIHVRPGDLFLGLDLSAHVIPGQRRQLAAWKRQGVSLHFVVYDLLAIHHPDWFSPQLAAAIRRWVRSLAILADSAICISPVVRDDFEAWVVGRYGLAAGEIATAVIPMGHDIQATAPSRGLPEGFEALCASLAARPTALMVGTLEPRKGHAQVVAGFEVIWSRGTEANLVIVGRPGWKTEALQAHLRGHPERGRRLFWLDDASDEALARLYQICDGVIVASLGEGFGLPLVEALGHGKPVLARDLPVFRSHASPGLEFFDAIDAGILADQLVVWLARLRAGTSSRRVGGAALPSWRESSSALVAHLEKEIFCRIHET